ncbi:hypothetical protein, partial [Croceitalea sp. P059]|uniref:hypothetical protein n=1 Tax=Croceitalea sp. P059 TaxID=3075601 RepID=UPI0028879BFD
MVTVCSGAEYYWQLADKSYTAADSPVMITLEDGNGCEYTATLTINEHPVTDDIEEEVTVCSGAEYYWQLSDKSYTAADSPVMITLEDDNGCEYMATLTIKEGQPS